MKWLVIPMLVGQLAYRGNANSDGSIVQAAWVEMLGRGPKKAEREHWADWLRMTHANGDMLRRNLMSTPEFVGLHGYVDPLDLHSWRNDRWLEMILKTCSVYQLKGRDWPDEREWNESLLEALLN